MNNTVQKRFFEDPEWHLVTEMVEKFIEPLLNMDSIDVNQPAEHVKAEIIGRRLAHKALNDFCEQSKLITRPKKNPEYNNPFK